MSKRIFDLPVAQTVIQMPCFFPSVSSVKTHLMPVDYTEFLEAAAQPLFLVSAYDIAHCLPEQYMRMIASLQRSKARGTVILMDSGNYESFWKGGSVWTPERYQEITRASEYHLCFCYDNLKPPDSAEEIAEDVVSRVLQCQDHASGTVVPIIHGPTELLPFISRMVAEELYPLLIAIPERELGYGIFHRTQTVRRIRESLNEAGLYCPLHLLGTGNPLSIIAYAMAGADSFDGLEWCQTVVNHETGKLFHFQQWDLFKEQTEWGYNDLLPYTQSVLMHNLVFYAKFMRDLREALINDLVAAILGRYVSERQATQLINAARGDY